MSVEPDIDPFSRNIWKDWTPTYAAITVGDGTVTARYLHFGKLVVCYWELVLGSTSTIGSSHTISAPVTATTSYNLADNTIGTSRCEESGNQGFLGSVRLQSTTTLRCMMGATAGTYVQEAAITASVPFTWGTADIFMFSATYEAA